MYIRVYVYTCIHVYIVYCILYIVYVHVYVCIYIYTHTYTGIVEGIWENDCTTLSGASIARGVPWHRSSQLWPWSFWDRLRWSPESNKPHTGDLQTKTQTYTAFLTYPLNETYRRTNPSCLCLYIYIEILCIPHIPTNMKKQKYIPKFRAAPPVSPHKTAGRTVPSSGAF